MAENNTLEEEICSVVINKYLIPNFDFQSEEKLVAAYLRILAVIDFNYELSSKELMDTNLQLKHISKCLLQLNLSYLVPKPINLLHKKKALRVFSALHDKVEAKHGADFPIKLRRVIKREDLKLRSKKVIVKQSTVADKALVEAVDESKTTVTQDEWLKSGEVESKLSDQHTDWNQVISSGREIPRTPLKVAPSHSQEVPVNKIKENNATSVTAFNFDDVVVPAALKRKLHNDIILSPPCNKNTGDEPKASSNSFDKTVGPNTAKLLLKEISSVKDSLENVQCSSGGTLPKSEIPRSSLHQTRTSAPHTSPSSLDFLCRPPLDFDAPTTPVNKISTHNTSSSSYSQYDKVFLPSPPFSEVVSPRIMHPIYVTPPLEFRSECDKYRYFLPEESEIKKERKCLKVQQEVGKSIINNFENSFSIFPTKLNTQSEVVEKEVSMEKGNKASKQKEIKDEYSNKLSVKSKKATKEKQIATPVEDLVDSVESKSSKDYPNRLKRSTKSKNTAEVIKDLPKITNDENKLDLIASEKQKSDLVTLKKSKSAKSLRKCTSSTEVAGKDGIKDLPESTKDGNKVDLIASEEQKSDLVTLKKSKSAKSLRKCTSSTEVAGKDGIKDLPESTKDGNKVDLIASEEQKSDLVTLKKSKSAKSLRKCTSSTEVAGKDGIKDLPESTTDGNKVDLIASEEQKSDLVTLKKSKSAKSLRKCTSSTEVAGKDGIKDLPESTTDGNKVDLIASEEQKSDLATLKKSKSAKSLRKCTSSTEVAGKDGIKDLPESTKDGNKVDLIASEEQKSDLVTLKKSKSAKSLRKCTSSTEVAGKDGIKDLPESTKDGNKVDLIASEEQKSDLVTLKKSKSAKSLRKCTSSTEVAGKDGIKDLPESTTDGNKVDLIASEEQKSDLATLKKSKSAKSLRKCTSSTKVAGKDGIKDLPEITKDGNQFDLIASEEQKSDLVASKKPKSSKSLRKCVSSTTVAGEDKPSEILSNAKLIQKSQSATNLGNAELKNIPSMGPDQINVTSTNEKSIRVSSKNDKENEELRKVDTKIGRKKLSEKTGIKEKQKKITEKKTEESDDHLLRSPLQAINCRPSRRCKTIAADAIAKVLEESL